MQGAKKGLTLLKKGLGAVLTLALMAFSAFSLIMARPDAKEAEAAAQQAWLSPSPAMSIQAENDLRELVAAFPVPVMSFMSGSGMQFVSGASEDVVLPGGTGRVLTLYWQTEAGQPLRLESIYPADSLDLLKSGDYHFSATAGPTLFGSASVRMEDGDTLRIHVRTEQGLYVVTAPKTLAGEISGICRSLQLFTAD